MFIAVITIITVIIVIAVITEKTKEKMEKNGAIKKVQSKRCNQKGNVHLNSYLAYDILA